jgi:hypothetical protein
MTRCERLLRGESRDHTVAACIVRSCLRQAAHARVLGVVLRSTRFSRITKTAVLRFYSQNVNLKGDFCLVETGSSTPARRMLGKEPRALQASWQTIPWQTWSTSNGCKSRCAIRKIIDLGNLIICFVDQFAPQPVGHLSYRRDDTCFFLPAGSAP